MVFIIPIIKNAAELEIFVPRLKTLGKRLECCLHNLPFCKNYSNTIITISLYVPIYTKSEDEVHQKTRKGQDKSVQKKGPNILSGNLNLGTAMARITTRTQFTGIQVNTTVIVSCLGNSEMDIL